MTPERLAEIKKLKTDKQSDLKNKKFTTLSTKEKDALLETVAKMLGLIDE